MPIDLRFRKKNTPLTKTLCRNNSTTTTLVRKIALIICHFIDITQNDMKINRSKYLNSRPDANHTVDSKSASSVTK